MQSLNIISLLFILFATAASGEENILKHWNLSDSISESITKGNLYADAKVDTLAKKKGQKLADQSFDFIIAGLHPKSCQIALRKLSKYENFKDWLSFMKRSDYSAKSQMIQLKVDHFLFPVPLIISFKIPRITKAGDYPYQFPHGFLKGLKGTIYVREVKGRCLFVTDAKWLGPDTKYPDIVLSIFSETVSKLGMKRLFRISSI